MNAKQLKVLEMRDAFVEAIKALPNDGTPVPIVVVVGIMQSNADGTKFELSDTHANGNVTPGCAAELIKFDARKIEQWEEHIKAMRERVNVPTAAPTVPEKKPRKKSKRSKK